MKNKRAQSTIEFALLIFFSVAALLSMSVYIKRAVQGHMRSQSNSLGEQYDPRATTSNMAWDRTGTTVIESESWESEGITVSTSAITVEGDISSRSGTESIGPMGGLWD